MTKIGENIKKLRQVKNLTQQSFADLFEVSRGNISSYEEKRAEPKIETISKIAKYFSIPIGHLIEKNLTVNEILHFDNYFGEENPIQNVKNLSKIPFLSREVLQEKKQIFSNLDNHSIIYFPTYNSNKFIAVEFNSNVSAPIEFQYEENTILFFENLLVDNLHLINDKIGFYLNDDDFFIGKYILVDSKLFLELNQWKKVELNLEDINHFYVLNSIHKKV